MADNKKTVLNPSIPLVTEINATELRANTRNILERAKFHGERFVVLTYGQPMAVLIGVGEFATLTAEADPQSPAPQRASD